MNYKIISEEDFLMFFPNLTVNEDYRKMYSCYRFYLESYLNKVLFLEDIEKQIRDGNLGVNIDSLCKRISNLGFDYVFLVNSISLEKLPKAELDKFWQLMYVNDEVGILNFVVNTFRNLLDNNGSVVLGIDVKSDVRFQEFLREKANHYIQILNIPVNFRNINEKLNVDILKQYPKYLPLGSIVILKEGTQKIMIVGYATIDLEKKDKIYDYIGCMYPEGIVDTKKNIVFNHDNIKVLLALGFSDDEHKEFLKDMVDTLGDSVYQQEILSKL